MTDKTSAEDVAHVAAALRNLAASEPGQVGVFRFVNELRSAVDPFENVAALLETLVAERDAAVIERDEVRTNLNDRIADLLEDIRKLEEMTVG